MNSQLFEENASKLKHIFSRIASKDGHLSLANFQIFCKNLNIIPGLITPVDLKRYMDKIIKVSSSRGSLSYSQFEGLLKDFCFSSFQSSMPAERISLFFAHINEPCLANYKISMITGHRRKHHSNDFSAKREEGNSSLDIDNNIKEALETLKSKDESFRSSRSTISREVSPVPVIRSRTGNVAGELKVSVSTSNLQKRPFANKSVPDSPNTSVLGARPNSRYHVTNSKESELDEFLKTEKLVENEIVKVKGNYSAGRSVQKGVGKNTISIKKVEYSKSKPNLNGHKIPPLRPSDSQKNIVVKLDRNRITSPKHCKKISVTLNASKIQVPNSSTKSEVLLKKHKKFIKNHIPQLFSKQFVMSIAFMLWKQESLSFRKVKS